MEQNQEETTAEGPGRTWAYLPESLENLFAAHAHLGCGHFYPIRVKATWKLDTNVAENIFPHS